MNVIHMILLYLNTHLISPNSVDIDGDIIIGGLVPVHEKGTNGRHCGAIMEGRGIHRAMAMIYAIENINKDKNLLPGIKLGTKILDTCSNEQYALNMSMQFVQNIMIEQKTSDYACSDRSEPTLRVPLRPLAGVIGASYSGVTTMVAHFLRIFQVVQISPAATNPQLSDKSRFDFFARTVASDKFQAQVIADLLKHFNWTYVSLLHSDTDYGRMGAESFKSIAARSEICIAFEGKLTDNLRTYREVLSEITAFSQKDIGAAKVVVLFARNDHVRELLQIAARERRTGFQWVASDGWETTTNRIVQGFEEVANGAMIIAPRATRIPEFEAFFKDWNPWTDVYGSKWLYEWWMEKFNCSLGGDKFRGRRSICAEDNSDQRISDKNFAPDDKLEFVIDAVYALAHALNDLHKARCGGKDGLCPAMLTKEGTSIFSGREFYNEYLLKVSFQSINRETMFSFDKNGDGPPAYSVKNFQFLANQQESSTSTYVQVGEWTKGLTLDEGMPITWPRGDIPISTCSPQCKVGEKLMQPPSSCCWSCVPCDRNSKVSENGNDCEACPKGFWPTEDRLDCYDMKDDLVQVLEWDSAYAIVCVSLSSLGMIFTLFVISVLIKFRETPVVKASGRELSFTILGSIFLSYLMTFIIIVRPSPAVCVIRRIGTGLSFCGLYSGLLVKTNRIYRIFESAKYSAQRPKYISPQSQIVITAILVSVQILVSVITLLVQPPGVYTDYPEPQPQAVLRCRGSGYIFLCSLVYVAVLILVCTVFAILTRKVPENFNETKFIGFSMYTTCIIWLAFLPIYFGTGSDFRIQATALCVSISLSATVSLVLLFSPKLWVIFLEPEKNKPKPKGIASLVVGYHAQHAAAAAAAAAARKEQEEEEERQKSPSPSSPLLANNVATPKFSQDNSISQFRALAAAEVLRNEGFLGSNVDDETNVDDGFENDMNDIFM